MLGIPSQFLLDAIYKFRSLSVPSNVLMQMNAKLNGDLRRYKELGSHDLTMVVGVDMVKKGRNSIFGMTASYSHYKTLHFSKVYHQQLAG